MAQATGYVCDVCGRFEYATKNSSSIQMPDEWIAVRPQTSHSPSANIDPLQVCSNRCLAELGIQRFEAENEGTRFQRKTGVRAPKPNSGRDWSLEYKKRKDRALRDKVSDQ